MTVIEIPLRRRDGSIRAMALIDDRDAHLAEFRWSLHSKGYVRRTVTGADGVHRSVFLHRAIFGLVPGDGREVDHRDGNRLDCRRDNLRECSPAQNRQNRASRPGSVSGFRGVSWSKSNKKWQAQHTLNYVHHHLGFYDDEDEAARVAAEFRAAHMEFSLER